MVTYTCDKCKEEIIEEINVITIGSDKGDLHFRNNQPKSTTKLNRLTNMHDLHFCEKKCFVNYFFNTK